MGSQPHAPAASTPGKDPVPIVQEAGWAPGWVWTGGKSRPYQDLIPDRPAHSRYTDWATRPTLLLEHGAYLQHSKCVHLYMWPVVTAASSLLLFSLYHMLEVVSLLLLTSCNLPQYSPSSSVHILISSQLHCWILYSITLLNFAICFNRIDLCG